MGAVGMGPLMDSNYVVQVGLVGGERGKSGSATIFPPPNADETGQRSLSVQEGRVCAKGRNAGHVAIVWASLSIADLRGSITAAHYSPNQRQTQ